MSHTERAEEELKRLESMHERVAKLRSRLKTLELDTYSAMGLTDQDFRESAEEADGVSKNYS
jgi:predicted translin family RNA/ssDNA-binding protein